MSNYRSNTAELVVTLCAIATISGCENATAPGKAPGLAEITPLRSSLASGAASQPDDRYIVVLHSQVADRDAASRALMSKTQGKMGRNFGSRFKGFTAQLTPDEATRLSKDPLVAYVEKNQRVAAQGGKPSSSSVTQSKAPWALDRIDQENIPLDGKFTYASTGAGVHIYIVDGGVRVTHREFEGRASADFTALDDGYGAIGCNAHGTEVASIAAGKTFGVAKKAFIHSVRVLDCNGGGDMVDVLAGIEWVINNGPRPAVINLSIAGPPSLALTEMLNLAIAQGIVVVAAAGNNADNACNYSPANVADAITVGATALLDQVPYFSNFGSCVDVSAPGDRVDVALNTNDRSTGFATGTSIAAPHVAGVAALYLQKYPNASAAEVTNSILGTASSQRLTGLRDQTPNLIVKL